MRFTISTIFAAALAIGAVTAKPVTHGSGAPPKGKVFDHILQIWFENQVKSML
jgi:hypothetical protein